MFGLYQDFFPTMELIKPENRWKYILLLFLLNNKVKKIILNNEEKKFPLTRINE